VQKDDRILASEHHNNKGKVNDTCGQ